MQDADYQHFLIRDELKCLLSRVKHFHYTLKELNLQQFQLFKASLQGKFNEKVEEVILLWIQICRIVLFQYGDNPKNISLDNQPTLSTSPILVKNEAT